MRAVVIVLDGVGIGELPDADLYGDVGSNTICNTAKAVGGLHLPNLQKMGLGNIANIQGVPPSDNPIASFGKMAEKSPGKDTTSGHWEIMGIILDKPFPTYPNGFPKDLIEEFEKRIGRKTLGNFPASGTEIIKQLGDEHCRTGYPIVYTSADSVFQIACNERIIPVNELYNMCEIAREILTGEHSVGRVIARPFVGDSPDTYIRTANRKDFSLKPPSDTILNLLQKSGITTCGVGKIEDIFAGSGLTKTVHTKNNMEGVDKTIEYVKSEKSAFIFTNLVDFDMLWGHRNDYENFAKGLQDFDNRLPEILDALSDGDLLIITADHGCDPTTPSTDHSREYVPLIAYTPLFKGKNKCDLGTRETFADIGATIADFFSVQGTGNGKSFLESILKQ